MPAEDYHVECLVGRGSFGEVYRGKNIHTGEVFALKMVDMEQASDVRDLAKEIHFLTQVRLPYLTKHHETFVQETRMWIVLEYCGGGSCSDFLKVFGRLSEDVCACILRDVLHGLDYLHRQNKVHRDIKLANILLTDRGEVKLGDFGVSGELSLTRSRKNTMVGTPYWMAPEVIKHTLRGYNSKADIWLLGITCIELVMGCAPLAGMDPMEAIFQIPLLKPPQLEGDFSSNIKDFVRYCCLKSAKRRPGASTLLHHQFISACPAVNMQQLVAKKRAKEPPRRKRHLKRTQVNKMLTIHWQFTPTFKDVPAPLLLRYGILVQQAFLNLLERAKTLCARDSVVALREQFAQAERTNSGLCHAFVEELEALATGD